MIGFFSLGNDSFFHLVMIVRDIILKFTPFYRLHKKVTSVNGCFLLLNTCSHRLPECVLPLMSFKGWVNPFCLPRVPVCVQHGMGLEEMVLLGIVQNFFRPQEAALYISIIMMIMRLIMLEVLMNNNVTTTMIFMIILLKQRTTSLDLAHHRVPRIFLQILIKIISKHCHFVELLPLISNQIFPKISQM